MQAVDQFLRVLRAELSGLRALDTTGAVARFNRIVGSSDYAAAVQLLADRLSGYGLDEVQIESFPIDGKQRYAERVFAPAWEPTAARLCVLSPAPYLICDFAETPMCLPSGCPATAPEGVTAEVVDVGGGDRAADYAEIDVHGKAVLASGLTTDVYNLAVEQYGAACVLSTNMYGWSDLPAYGRSMLDLPDATHLARLYHDPDTPRRAPAFSITYRHAQRLRRQLVDGPVTVHATVKAENKPGELLEVSALIRGSDLPDEEVWILAHLCHPKPGACDNASGVALGVEIMRGIAAALQKGALARPRRSIRLLLLPEVSGTQAYVDRYQAHMGQVIAALNLDMVGASYVATGAYCRLVQTPWSRPSYLNRLGAFLLEKTSLGARSHIRAEPVRDWLYAVAPYDKGSDHDVLLNATFGVPSLFFFSWPYRYYHTDQDTVDKLDPLEFERVGGVAGALALSAAAMTPDLAQGLLDLLRIEAGRDIALLRQQMHPILARSGNGIGPQEVGPVTIADDTDRLWALTQMECGALTSVLHALPDAEQSLLAAKVGALQSELRQLAAVDEDIAPRSTMSMDDPARHAVPQRVGVWPLMVGKVARQATDGEGRLRGLRAELCDFDDKAIAALNYVDGTRTVGQIARLVTGELGRMDAAHAMRLFELLAEGNVVSWSKRP